MIIKTRDLPHPWLLSFGVRLAVGFGLFLCLALVSRAGAEPLCFDEACRADCNQNGYVTASEIVLGLRISLEAEPLVTCESLDRDQDGFVSVDEITSVVTALLIPTPTLGASASASPTATRTGSQTRTPTRTATPDVPSPVALTQSVFAPALMCGQHLSGMPTREPSERWFSFHVPDTSSVWFSVTPAVFNGLVLLDRNGQQLSETSFLSENHLTFECGMNALPADDYFLVLRQDATTFDLRAYDLTVACVPCDQPNATPTAIATSTATRTPTAPAVDPYEPDDEPENASPIRCGETVRRSISSMDTDLFDLELAERAAVYLYSTIDSPYATIDSTSFQFLDREGVPVGSIQYGMASLRCTDGGLSGRNLIRVSSGTYPPHSYELTVLCTRCADEAPAPTPSPQGPPGFDVYEPNNFPNTASPIRCGEAQLHTIAPSGDVDWLSFNLETTSTLEILARDSIDNRNGPFIGLFDSSGDQAPRGDCGEGGTPAGMYFIQARPSFGLIGERSYGISIICSPCAPDVPTATPTATFYFPSPPPTPSADPFEVDNLPWQASFIGCNATQQRTITRGDQDWLAFDVTLPSAVDIRIDLNLRESVKTFDTRGQRAKFSPKQASSCAEPVHPGRYYAQVRSDFAQAYQITVTCLPCGVLANTPIRSATPTPLPDEYEPDDLPQTASPISCGEVQERSIDPYTLDWIRFIVPEHTAFTVRSGMDGAGPLLFDAEGQLVRETSSAVLSASCGADTVDPGEYFLKIQSFGFSRSAYDLSVACTPCDLPNPTPTPTRTPFPTLTPATPDQFEPDNTLPMSPLQTCPLFQRRSIAPSGDVDWLRFTLTSASSVNVIASSRGAGPPLDITLFVPGSDASSIQSARYSLSFSCAAPLPLGEYPLRVSTTDNTTAEYDLTLLCIPCS